MQSPVLSWGLLMLLAGSSGAPALEVEVTDSEGTPLADAVVYLPEMAPPTLAEAAVVDQVGKRFRPLVTAVARGAAITFPNSDNIRHHVYSFSPAKRFELKLYHGVPAEPVVFGEAGVVTLGCNIHDSMVAYVRVLDSGVYGISDAAGRVTLPSVAGTVTRLRVWHPFLAGEEPEQPITSGSHSVQVAVPLDRALKAQIEAVIR